MAEERLIDTDKDKKYRIRKNADGEDELFIDESADEESVEEVKFEVDQEQTAEDTDDTAAEMAEQLRKAEQEEKEKRRKEAEALIASARKECAERKYATAADYLEKAVDADPENGEIYALKLIVYTRDFTDYSRVRDAKEYCEEIEKYTAKETKEELFKRASAGLDENITKLKKTVSELDTENEKQKAERAKKFVSDRNKMLAVFCVGLVALAAFATLAIYYLVNVHAVPDNSNLILAIVFGALAVVLLLATTFALRKLLTACRRVRLNKRNSATKLGRELLTKRAELNAFVAIYKALKG